MIAATLGMLVVSSVAVHVDKSTDVTYSDQKAIVRSLGDALQDQTGIRPVIDSVESKGTCAYDDKCIADVLKRTNSSEVVFVQLIGTGVSTALALERTAGGGLPPTTARVELPRQKATWNAFLSGAAILLFPEGQNVTPPIVAVARPDAPAAQPIPLIDHPDYEKEIEQPKAKQAPVPKEPPPIVFVPPPPKPEPKPEPVAKVEPKPVPPPVVAKVEPPPVAKVEPKPMPVAKVEPKPEPVAKVEPKPEPVAKVEPKPEPVAKVEPKPAPVAKVEPKPAPVAKVEPKPVAKAQPKPEPKIIVAEKKPTPEPTKAAPASTPELVPIVKAPDVDKPDDKEMLAQADTKPTHDPAIDSVPMSSGSDTPGLSAADIESTVHLDEDGPNIWPWVAVGATVVAAGVGTFLGVRNRDLINTGKVEPDPVVRQDYQDRVYRSGLAANILFTTAAIGAVSSVVLFVVD